MISEDRIRERSHQIWLREGRPEGRALDHWMMAQAELKAEQSRHLRVLEYHTTVYRQEERVRTVLPRPTISLPPTKMVAQRVPRGLRPAAA